MLSRRYTFRAMNLEAQAERTYGDWDYGHISLSFTPHESFHAIVKRLAMQEDEDQLKLAYAAIENEMARRII